MSYLRLYFFLVAFVLSPFSASAEPLDINTANPQQLTQLMVGIGPAKAVAIVDYRGSHGPFSSIDELVQVKGIGPRTLELNRERITALPVPSKQ